MRNVIAVAVVAAVLVPAMALGGSIEDEVEAAVEATYAYIRENLRDQAEIIPAAGSLQFWSSGGLMLDVGPDSPVSEYEQFNLRPKHISVLPLSDGSAAALYYLEGSMWPKGRQPVEHYLTRVLAVYIKEDGAWKVRAGHWSPLVGGAGTSQPDG